MKDLVDFNNRDDFNHYMKQMEKSYYNQVNVSKPPYDAIPDFPPKPSSSKSTTHLANSGLENRREQENRDFIDKVLEANEKRQQ